MTRLRHALPTLLLLLALLPMSTMAIPADTTDTPQTETAAKMTIMNNLNSGVVAKQADAISLISHYAHVGRFDADFYSLMVTPLHALVSKGETESLRIMAISALYSIGTDTAMRGLKAQMDSFESERLTTVAENAIAQYEADRTATSQVRSSE
ncbi:hypothetical protein BSZ35_09740 [Salinibacter sp. 10B]|uniref:hypothetical protein n=1 Tax=Salinibacter sp. 10B TaxID=1923971 RepID=UPI000CF559A8|nr:hypothetical protein [Salinibacter sp. 10B]PQJ34846.1 hypothetical protein BSZ35_09740 [Salinibacter sp. 10B]